MSFFSLDPITDPRWCTFVQNHPRSSVFHRREWLQTLADTYRYKPMVVTSAPPGNPLADGVVFCNVDSWITGKRMVSLPFSDHVEPLFSDAAIENGLIDWLKEAKKKSHFRYIELRPLTWISPTPALASTQFFWVHTLDLTKPLEKLFQDLNKNNLQRRIRKAEREQLDYERGSSEKLLDEFCQLLLITRRRHHLLPQPRIWFRNLARNLKSDFEIRVARKDARPIAAIVTLRHSRTVVYKYGCSDESFHYLAGMPFLFWKVISESKAEGAEELDFGRTEPENEGLLRFKDQFGTARRRIDYLRYPPEADQSGVIPSRNVYLGKIVSNLPSFVSWRLGGMLYRHMA